MIYFVKFFKLTHKQSSRRVTQPNHVMAKLKMEQLKIVSIVHQRLLQSGLRKLSKKFIAQNFCRSNVVRGLRFFSTHSGPDHRT